jgi:hypothetical protein
MVSGGSDNPGGLENRAPAAASPRVTTAGPRPRFPAAGPRSPGQAACPPPAARTAPAGQPAARRGPPAAVSWCRVQPRPDGSRIRVVPVKISAARR